VSEDIGIWLHYLGLPEMRSEMDDMEAKANEVGSLWQRVKLTVREESRSVMRSVMGVFNLAKNILSAFGVSMGPMGDAVVTMIGSVIAGAMSMQAAYVAGGPAGWLMLGIAAISLGVAIGAQLRAMEGVATAKESAAKAQAIFNSLESIIAPWR